LRLLKISRFLRFLKLLRILKLSKALSKYEDILYSDKFNIISAFAKIVVVVSFFVHCMACLFWIVGSNSASVFGESWIISKGVIDESVS
jgi:hypothetical protein